MVKSQDAAQKSATAESRNRQAARAESWISRGATASVLGIALSLTEAREASGFVALLGLAACLIGLHRFGRSGPRLTSLSMASVVATQNSESHVAP